MKKSLNPDYTAMTAHAKNCGLVPYTDRWGKLKEGFYTMEGLEAPVDLTACALDEKSILRTALRQLSEQSDKAHHNSVERNLRD